MSELTRLAETMRATPQSERDPRRPEQERNAAGGYAFRVDDWGRLRRFLIIGTEGGTYYASPRELTRDNAEVVLRLLDADGPRVVAEAVAVSDAGVAPRNDQALFTLALAASHRDDATRAAALEALPLVARTGTHWFQFAAWVDGMRGWGRGLARAVAGLYTGQDVDRVALQAVKYRQRHGWTHRDLLRSAHPRPETPEARALVDWIAHGTVSESLPRVVRGYLLVNEPGVDARLAADTVREYRLPWEVLPDRLVTEPVVWDALLDDMGPTALLRNLPRLTRYGLIPPVGALDPRIGRLADPELLRRGRVHPMAVLNASMTYQRGEGRGGRDWTPNAQVAGLLDEAFHAAFPNVEPAGKVTLVALDVSPSMTTQNCSGMTAVTAREASAAMSMCLVRSEPSVGVVAFAGGGTYNRGSAAVRALPVTAGQRFDDVVRMVSGIDWSATDCSLPMRWAKEVRARVDTFVVYTDNETWSGPVHPHQALEDYRQSQGVDARLVVQAMTASPFTIADPRDPGMLDLVGFDSSSPRLLTEFSAGRL